MRPSSPIGSTVLLEDRDHDRGPSPDRSRRLLDVRDQLARGPRAVDEPNPLDIVGSFSGERIFITGATGFLGKVLVEKLLWSVPEVGKLLLLVRPDGERDTNARLREEVLGSPIMARLRALHADDWEAFAASRLEVVSGDLRQDRFGLDREAYEALCRGVDRVVASAATVTFDERLDSALELNARGARRTLALARDAGNVPLLHVSTCYVSGRRQGWIPERVAAPGEFDVDTTLAALDEACRRAPAETNTGESDDDGSLVAAGAEEARRHGFRDVYTLTMAIGTAPWSRASRRSPRALVNV